MDGIPGDRQLLYARRSDDIIGPWDETAGFIRDQELGNASSLRDREGRYYDLKGLRPAAYIALWYDVGDLAELQYVFGEAIALDLVLAGFLTGLFRFCPISLPNAFLNSVLQIADVSTDPIRLIVAQITLRPYACPLFFIKCNKLFILI